MNIIIKTQSDEIVFNTVAYTNEKNLAELIWDYWQIFDSALRAPEFYTETALGRFRVNNQLISLRQITALVRHANRVEKSAREYGTCDIAV